MPASPVSTSGAPTRKVFADTALIPQLSALWRTFVMPNIGALTLVLGLFHIACAALLVFITVPGYGFPATGVWEDIAKSRLITIVMSLLVLPLAIRR